MADMERTDDFVVDVDVVLVSSTTPGISVAPRACKIIKVMTIVTTALTGATDAVLTFGDGTDDLTQTLTIAGDAAVGTVTTLDMNPEEANNSFAAGERMNAVSDAGPTLGAARIALICRPL